MSPKDAEPIILQGLCHDKMGNAVKAEEAWLPSNTSAWQRPRLPSRLHGEPTSISNLLRPSCAALTDFKKFLDIAPPDTPSRHEAKQQVARLGGSKMQLGGTSQ